MIVRYCPACYAENATQDTTCHRCGAPLTAQTEEDYLAKLVWALGHPEPETRIRAAALLGRLGATAAPAVNALVQAYDTADDVHLRAAVVTACGRIGGADAAALAAKALEDQSYLVRLAAVAAVRDLLATGSTLDEQLRERVQAVAREDPSAGVREAAKTLLSSHILST